MAAALSPPPPPVAGLPVLRASGLVKHFAGHRVLDRVDLHLHAGQTLVVLGASGCGKSTLLRILAGLICPDQGAVELLGRDITRLPDTELDALRLKLGVLFQSGALFNSLTLRENVALPLREHTRLPDATIDIIVKMKLELVGLRRDADKYPAEISGGMKKRAGLARALALDPHILFYDEPTAGLDPVTSAQINQLIRQLSRRLGVASLVVTHDMDSAFAIADRMIMLDAGRVLLAGDRQVFDRLRRQTPPTPDDTPAAIVRQFLRGDAHGPLTARKSPSDYADDLLGSAPLPSNPLAR